MATVQRIETAESAAALALHLNGNARTKPATVVTTAHGHVEPWIDVAEIAKEAGDMAEVYLLPTGPVTREFSAHMAEGTQVYGGAGRAYPVGHAWVNDLYKSPLRFAFSETEGHRATQQLVSDTLRMAYEAGGASVGNSRNPLVEGTVKLTVAGRAVVDTGEAGFASIAEELVAPNVAIAQIVSAGQKVVGRFQAASGRLDISQSLRPAEIALAGLQVGDLALAKVHNVAETEASLLLYPKTTTDPVVVTLHQGEVTEDADDDLRSLMSPGEVLTVEVRRIGAPLATGREWRATLAPDDSAPTFAAASLLDGGPPWLIPELNELALVEDPLPTRPVPTPPPSRKGVREAEAIPSDKATSLSQLPSPPGTGATTPTPPARTSTPSRPVPRPPSAVQRAMSDTISELRDQIATLTAELANVRAEDAGTAGEADQLRYLLAIEERRANRAENELRGARSRLRRASNSRTLAPSGDVPTFADPEAGFRHLVTTRWAVRTLPSEQASRPLREYTLGPDFLDSLSTLQGIKEEKVADVVVEIVTGLAPQLPAREVHRLRTGGGGDDPQRQREDGAVAWRASLQAKTPSARRIHYWILPTGEFELAKVATHDDFTT